MEKEKDGFPITSLREINMLLKCGSHPNIVNLRVTFNLSKERGASTQMGQRLLPSLIHEQEILYLLSDIFFGFVLKWLSMREMGNLFIVEEGWVIYLLYHLSFSQRKQKWRGIFIPPTIGMCIFQYLSHCLRIYFFLIETFDLELLFFQSFSPNKGLFNFYYINYLIGDCCRFVYE